jgi:hypothetical protein
MRNELDFARSRVLSLTLSSQAQIDLITTNASRVPRESSGVTPSTRSFNLERLCVDNNLEAAVTGVHVHLRREPIRDGVEEEEARRGLLGRAAESSNYGLIPRAGL